MRLFRYEIPRRPDGRIDDLAEAVASPQCLTTDGSLAQIVLDLVPSVPTATWGRDEFGTGEMWNSNSVIAWLLARAEFPSTECGHQPADEHPAGMAG